VICLDANELKKTLTIDNIKTLLTELGVQHIIDHSQNSQKGNCLVTNTICHKVSDGSMKLYYYTESFQFHCYTDCGENMDIFELVKRNHLLKGVELSFIECVSWVCATLGISFYDNTISSQEGFRVHYNVSNDENEWMKRFKKKKPPKIEVKTHSDKVFNMFSNFHHPSFLEDGISHEAMSKFEVMYDCVKHRVIIPHRRWNDGKLIGIKTRNLNQWEIDAGYKYLPLTAHNILYSYPTMMNIYGYWENKSNILSSSSAIIFEAEKSVMQMETMYPEGNNSLAIMGSTLNSKQAEILIKSGVKEVTLALDKENNDTLDEKSIEYQEKLLRIGRILSPHMKVYVLYDDEGVIPEKSSPSDLGKEVFEFLMSKRKEILNKE